MFLFAILPRNGTTDNTFIAPSVRAGIDKTCLAFFFLFGMGFVFAPRKMMEETQTAHESVKPG
jgi:hypothetical protein